MKRVLGVGLLLALLAVLVLVLASCESADNAAARRALAEADRTRAAGEAYARQVAADSAAASERAAIREAQRDAAHERALEVLPYILLIAGLLLLAGFAAWLLAFRVVAGNRSDVALVGYLQRLELAAAERDRELWRAIATLERRALGEGDRREVVIFDDRRHK